MGVNSHVTSVHTELQRLAERLRGQTRTEAGKHPGVDLQNTLRKTICDALPRNEDVQGNFRVEDLRRRLGDTLPMSARLPVHCSPTLNATSRDEQGSPGSRELEQGKTPLPILQNNRRTPSFRRRTVKTTYGEYNIVFATVLWRSRVICIYHEGVNLNDTEHYEPETTVSIRPTSWVPARCLSLQFSRSLRGWTWSGRQHRRVPGDSLIFEYCRNGNFAGARDLFHHNLASPFDVDIDGKTALHVSKHKAFGWKYAFEADKF